LKKQSGFKLVLESLRSFLQNPLALTVGLCFAADSFLFGSWVAHIPHVKMQLALSEAQLGLALFGMPLGLLIANPFSPGLIARYGLSGVTLTSLILLALSFALPMWMPDRWTLMGALFLVGVSVAFLNVAINTCATNLERHQSIYIMSTCHGMWSAGGMLGSGLAAVLIRLGVDPAWHLTAIAIVVLLGSVWGLKPWLTQIPEDRRASEMRSGRPGFVWPNRLLLFMILIGVCISLGEGVAFDWSAVYLREELGARPALAALGFTCFSMSMMAMRFTGDVLIPRFGEQRLLYFSVLTSALALLIVVLSNTVWLGILGFFVLGAGVALGAPILFNASARVPGYAQGAGLATYATFSFMGFLVGPPLVGYLGEAFGLPWAFALVIVLLLASVLAIRFVRTEASV
jgi:MFS family permease